MCQSQIQLHASHSGMQFVSSNDEIVVKNETARSGGGYLHQIEEQDVQTEKEELTQIEEQVNPSCLNVILLLSMRGSIRI